MHVESDGSVFGELFGPFVGIIESDDFGAWRMEAKAVGIKLTMYFGICGLGR